MIVKGILMGLVLVAPTAAAQLRIPRIANPLKAVAPVGVVQFDERVLEITTERMEAFVRGLAAEQAMAAKVDAQDLDAIARANEVADSRYRREYEAFEVRERQWQACSDKQVASFQRQIENLRPTATQSQLDALTARIQAAKDRGDIAEVIRLSDSISKAMAPANQAAAAIPDAMLQKVRTECGARPQEPARPSQQPTIGYQEIARAGRQASGLTDVQYSIFRERVAPFAINGRGGSGLVYMPGELSVLNNSRTALAPYRDLLTRF